MEHLPSALQAASIGGAAILATHPDDGAHLTFYGIVFAGICSIVTTVINRRADRERESERYARDKEAREFLASQIRGVAATSGALVAEGQPSKKEKNE